MGVVKHPTAQLTGAACVSLQPQYTEDKSRGMTQTCTVKSNKTSKEQAWSKSANFPAKFHFPKQPGGTNCNAEGQFVAFQGPDEGFFEKYLSLPRTTQSLTSVYL